jgi:hypothetical protein
MQRYVLGSLLAGAAALTPEWAGAVVPVPDPPPPECLKQQSTMERLRPLLNNLYSESPLVQTPSSVDGGWPQCVSSTEITATVTDDRAQHEFHKRFPDLAAERFGNSLYIDVAALRDHSDGLVSTLCAIVPFVLNLQLSVGVLPATMKEGVGSNKNATWLGAIEAPLPDPNRGPSRFTVAVIDGPVRRDHNDLPAIKHMVVTHPMKSDGRCDGTNCCEEDLDNDPHISVVHPAWTIGTIAAKQGNGLGPDGLSIPKAIIAIDPGSRSCPTMWRMATAIACAVEQHADIIDYAAEPVGGYDMQDLFEPVLENATNAGQLLVFPAGNQAVNLDKFPAWPNAFNKNALTVTSFEENGGTGANTGFGPATVDLGLPLGEVYTTANCSPDCYGTYDRTSAASAIVTGSVLLMSEYENFKQCTPAELGELLTQFAVPPTNSAVRRAISPSGGQLNLHFLATNAKDAQGSPINYCLHSP